MTTDTICALATATGGALGIIRISGPQALEILSHVFSKDLTNVEPNTIHYGHIKADEEMIDEVMVQKSAVTALAISSTRYWNF